ncbi:MAG: prepilin-type N-terminal cleavage/methylation domain-containing protein [Candidatus Gracilibacteria bacterium]|nr:prepilin-type N-terminal cleavage/methylation domain-containing protein [Candidatus Gracilibacteria bacterium]MDD2908835.1 prepilin-type N-terminal cleavage/methylation domain-containing protein [Candidatus Gracilibacteria bacterium]
MITINKQYSIPFIKEEQKGIKILKTKNYKPKTTSAFTLVELIVVIVILAILSTIAFLSFSSQSSSARDSARQADISNISKGLQVFKAMSATYPTPDSPVTITAGTGYSIIQGTIGKKYSRYSQDEGSKR